MIGKFKKPRCFKNVYELPLQYEANKNAWMTSELFLNWLKNMDQYFQKQNKKIALILDNCTAQPSVNLENIELIFLPPNTTSVLQPCDQGVIKNLKHHYRKIILTKYLTAIEMKQKLDVNVLEALFMLKRLGKM